VAVKKTGDDVQNFFTAAAVGGLECSLRLLPPGVDFPAAEAVIALTVPG
jgi:hypothetical protein